MGSQEKGVTMITDHGEVEHERSVRSGRYNLLIKKRLLTLENVDVRVAAAFKAKIRDHNHARP